MRKATLILVVVIALGCLAMADLTGVPTYTNSGKDVLGPHLGYGRGCVMCHAPHSGPAGNNIKASDAQAGEYALWGQDLTPLYGQTLTFSGDGAATYVVNLPAKGTITSAHDANTIILFCLSCHDGNLAKPGMMKGVTVETLPVVGGTAPTFLGADGSGATNPYQNDHPVGGAAIVTCGGTWAWDCTGGNTTAISMNGPMSSVFATTNYSFGVGRNFGTFGTAVTAVTCTTCHNQHSMVYKASGNYYYSMFFLRGYYNPNSGGNSAAQFCRQCHGAEGNEMNGQMNVPTT